MENAYTYVEGSPLSTFLLIADHASNHVPVDVDLRIAGELLDTHIALDIGVSALGRALCRARNFPGIFGGISRLVVDLNREEDAPHIIPTASDGHVIVGNALSHKERQARIDRYWRPYHDKIARQIVEQKPKLLVSLHSFTPRLVANPDVQRPWQVGILYNMDDRAARVAIPLLKAAGVIVGDQLPYSGKLLNATMNRHGESNGIAYLGIEMRQDLIATDHGVDHWAKLLNPILQVVLESLPPPPPIVYHDLHA